MTPQEASAMWAALEERQNDLEQAHRALRTLSIKVMMLIAKVRGAWFS